MGSAASRTANPEDSCAVSAEGNIDAAPAHANDVMNSRRVMLSGSTRRRRPGRWFALNSFALTGEGAFLLFSLIVLTICSLPGAWEIAHRHSKAWRTTMVPRRSGCDARGSKHVPPLSLCRYVLFPCR
jgi:hypothetical protein